MATWPADQLDKRFGTTVQVQYFDLFDPACPILPDNTQLPVVLVNDDGITIGGKVSIPAIRKRLEEPYFPVYRNLLFRNLSGTEKRRGLFAFLDLWKIVLSGKIE